MNIRKLLHSFKHAWRGVEYTFKHEQNFRVQVCIAFLVVLCTFVFNLSKSETIMLYLMITIVLLLELLNTAFEKTLDLLKPRMNLHVQTVKDIMAAMVLLASCAALAIGLTILFPHIVAVIGDLSHIIIELFT